MSIHSTYWIWIKLILHKKCTQQLQWQHTKIPAFLPCLPPSNHSPCSGSNWSVKMEYFRPLFHPLWSPFLFFPLILLCCHGQNPFHHCCNKTPPLPWQVAGQEMEHVTRLYCPSPPGHSVHLCWGRCGPDGMHHCLDVFACHGRHTAIQDRELHHGFCGGVSTWTGIVAVGHDRGGVGWARRSAMERTLLPLLTRMTKITVQIIFL